MAKIQIEWLSDCYSGCETCGPSYAEGAQVFIDGQLAIDLHPVAHCYNGANYDSYEVFHRILQHFGHTVEDPDVV